MLKKLLLSAVVVSIISGCGGGASSERNGNVNSSSNNHSIKAYNLWEYMTPSSDKTNNYSVYSNNQQSSKYQTTFKVKQNRVTESSTYAKGENTIYEKRNSSIIIKFTKNGKPNGMYSLHLWADIGDIITQRSSNCELKAHYAQKEIEGKLFNDVIEIKCGNIPGFYQKGVGEIAQIDNSNDKKVRVLSK